MARVLVVGPADERTASLEAMTRARSHSVLVSTDLAHAMLLQRMFKPDVVVAPRLLGGAERAVLASSAPAPLVLLVDLQVGGQLTLVAEGAARVLPSSPSTAQIEAVTGGALAREGPVARIVAQLLLAEASGTVTLTATESDDVVADLIVQGGRVTATRNGPDLRALLSREAPVRASFRTGVDDDEDFTIDFDDDDDEPVTELAPDLRAAAAARLSPVRVLLADGDRDLLRFHEVLLGRQGYDVQTALDGDDALTRARRFAPDVFVADAAMAGRSGWDLLGLVRGSAGLRETPVVLTGYDGAWLARLHKAGCGAEAVVEHGMRRGRLVEAIERVVGPRRELALAIEATSTLATVQGRLRGTGPHTLLRCLAERRFGGRLTVTVGDERFLVVTHDGGLVFARVSKDGATRMGRDALVALLRLGGGAFSLARDTKLGPAQQPLDAAIDDAVGVVDRDADEAQRDLLADGGQLALRGDLLAAFRAVCQTAWRPVVDHVASGRDARELLARGVDPMLVDTVMRDLFRKGAVRMW
jgi:CheY-like chemotaxis protein